MKNNLTLIWPRNCVFGIPTAALPVYLIGWIYNDGKICVLGTACDNSLQRLKDRMERHSHDFNRQLGWTVFPIVLGNVESVDVELPLWQEMQQEPVWLSVARCDKFPRISSLHKSGVLVKFSQLQIILYDALHPNSGEHYTINKVILTLSDWTPPPVSSSTNNISGSRGNEKIFYENIEKHTIESAQASSRSFSVCFRELNQSAKWQYILANTKIPQSHDSAWYNALKQYLFRFFYGAVICFVYLSRPLSAVGIALANMRFPAQLVNGLAINQISITARQVELRCRQLRLWPEQMVFVKQLKLERKETYAYHSSHALRQAHTLHFMNHMTLLLLDLVLGIFFGKYVVSNCQFLADNFIGMFQEHGVKNLHLSIRWLMGVPAGLKLNQELDAVIGHMLLFLVDLWNLFLQVLLLFLPSLLYFTGTCSIVFGASFMLALFSDTLAVATLHISSFYMLMAILYKTQLDLMGSMLLLFRGLKRNVLKQRIDPHEYDLDQVLVGTLCFTLLVFLFPTTVVYYVLFAGTRSLLVFVHGAIEFIVATLHFCPVFTVGVYWWNPKALQSGMYLEENFVSESNRVNVVCFTLKNSSIAILDVFANYTTVIASLVTHYLSPRALRFLIRGHTFRPLNLKFPKMPDTRYSLVELKPLLYRYVVREHLESQSKVDTATCIVNK